MLNNLHIAWAFVVSFLVVLVVVPPVIALAGRLGVVDKPGPRRVNVTPMPRFGGPAMYLGLLASAIPYVLHVKHGVPILIGAFLYLLIGMIDDIRGLRALVKLFVHVGIAALSWFLGIRVAYVTSPWSVDGVLILPAYVSFAVTVLWIVGITNTLNLIDGLDGLAAGITCIASITLLLVSLDKGQTESACLAASMTGLSAGFLRWNFYPAKTFMGDSGAYFLGYMLAVISIQGAFKSTVGLTYLVPVFVLGIPIFDTSFAMARRLQSRKPIMSEPDRGHIHHRMIDSGVKHRNAVMYFYMMTLGLGVVSLLLARAWQLAVYLVCAIVALVPVIMLSARVFKRRKRPPVPAQAPADDGEDS